MLSRKENVQSELILYTMKDKFGIVPLNEDKLIGSISLEHINYINGIYRNMYKK